MKLALKQVRCPRAASPLGHGQTERRSLTGILSKEWFCFLFPVLNAHKAGTFSEKPRTVRIANGYQFHVIEGEGCRRKLPNGFVVVRAVAGVVFLVRRCSVLLDQHSFDIMEYSIAVAGLEGAGILEAQCNGFHSVRIWSRLNSSLEQVCSNPHYWYR
jgi:hypothetical protein